MPALPVRPECLHWARFHAAGDGVWGGLDAGERRLLRLSPARRTDKGAA